MNKKEKSKYVNSLIIILFGCFLSGLTGIGLLTLYVSEFKTLTGSVLYSSYMFSSIIVIIFTSYALSEMRIEK